MNPDQFGSDSWAMLHLISLKYDNWIKTRRDPPSEILTFLSLFPRLVQCVYCRHDAQAFDKYIDLQFGTLSILARSGLLFDRSVFLHNLVNHKINKYVMPVAEARGIWMDLFERNFKYNTFENEEFWVYLTTVMLHFDKHGESDKKQLYRALMDCLPAVIKWVADTNAQVCQDMLTCKSKTTSEECVRTLLKCGEFVDFIIGSNGQISNKIIEVMHRYNAHDIIETVKKRNKCNIFH